MLFHPEIYFKDCDECKAYIMVNGKPHLTPDGKKIDRREGEEPSCKMCDKSAITLLKDENWRTWQMYLRHKHIGLEENERRDPLVQRHIIMLGEIEAVANIRRNPMMGVL